MNRLTWLNSKKDLVECVKSLYYSGFNSPVSGNHSIRSGAQYMWITPSAVPRYNLKIKDLVKINLNSSKFSGKKKPSVEWQMHRNIYLNRKDVNAVVHTHSPFTIAVAISDKLTHVIEEAKIVVGEPKVIPNEPSGSSELAANVSNSLSDGTNTVIVMNHGVVAVGDDIHKARAIVESLEEWCKILAISKIFGGPREIL